MVSKRILIASSIAIICMIQLVACRPGDDDSEGDGKAAETADAATPAIEIEPPPPKPTVSLKPKMRKFTESNLDPPDYEDYEQEEEKKKEKKPKLKRHNIIIRKLVSLAKFCWRPFKSTWNLVKKGARRIGCLKNNSTEEED